jgi:hypothetical protein
MQVDFWRYAHALKQCRKRTGAEPGGLMAKLPRSVSSRLMRASA